MIIYKMENSDFVNYQPTMVIEHKENISSNMTEINKYFENYYNK